MYNMAYTKEKIIWIDIKVGENMEQELLQKVFEVVTKLSTRIDEVALELSDKVETLTSRVDSIEILTSSRADSIETLISRVDSIEMLTSSRADSMETLISRVDSIETTVNTLKDLPKEVRKINKQLVEIDSNIRYLWEDFKMLEEKMQKKECSKIG